MRRSTFAALAGLTALATVACGQSGSEIADLSLVTRLPKEVGSGGLTSRIEETGMAKGYFFKAAIQDCGAAVLDSARAWAGRHGFTEAEGSVIPRSANIRLDSDAGKGTLVIRYSRASDGSTGRVSITHEHGADGASPTPQDLVAMGTPELVDGEIAAAHCDMGG
jgi:hypothetical protein